MSFYDDVMGNFSKEEQEAIKRRDQSKMSGNILDDFQQSLALKDYYDKQEPQKGSFAYDIFNGTDYSIIRDNDSFIQESVKRKEYEKQQENAGRLIKKRTLADDIKDDIWSDGYQFGDILKTGFVNIGQAGATVIDLGARFITGGYRFGEAIGDQISLGIAGLSGNKELQDRVQKNVAVNSHEEALKAIGVGHGTEIEKLSGAGEMAQGISVSIGDSLFRIMLARGLSTLAEGAGMSAAATQKLTTAAQNVMTFQTGYNSGVEEALRSGKDLKYALIYGIATGTAETIGENISAAIPALGKTFGPAGSTALSDFINKNVISKIPNVIARNITAQGIAAVGEGVEEIVTSFLNSFAKSVGKWDGENTKDVFGYMADDNWLEQFISGAISGGLMGAPIAAYASSKGVDMTTGQTQAELNEEFNSQNEFAKIIKVNTPVIESLKTLQKEGIIKYKKDSYVPFADYSIEGEKPIVTVNPAIKLDVVENKTGIRPGVTFKLDGNVDLVDLSSGATLYSNMNARPQEASNYIVRLLTNPSASEKITLENAIKEKMASIQGIVEQHKANTKFQEAYKQERENVEGQLKKAESEITKTLNVGKENNISFEDMNKYADSFDKAIKETKKETKTEPVEYDKNAKEIIENFKRITAQDYKSKLMTASEVAKVFSESRTEQFEDTPGSKGYIRITDKEGNESFPATSTEKITNKGGFTIKEVGQKNVPQAYATLTDKKGKIISQVEIKRSRSGKYNAKDVVKALQKVNMYAKPTQTNKTITDMSKKQKSLKNDSGASKSLTNKEKLTKDKNESIISGKTSEDLPAVIGNGKKAINKYDYFSDSYIKGIDETIKTRNKNKSGQGAVAFGDYLFVYDRFDDIDRNDILRAYNLTKVSKELLNELEEFYNEGNSITEGFGTLTKESELSKRYSDLYTSIDERATAEANDEISTRQRERKQRTNTGRGSKQIYGNNLKNSKQGSFSNDVDYEAIPTQTTDDQGRNLSKETQKYFKDSKVRNAKGQLKTIYHTTTDEGIPFYEFNPVGTPHYRFGDQAVNYFTDSEDMSASYAPGEYELQDTTKFESVEQANEWLEKYSNRFSEPYTYKIVKNENEYMLNQYESDNLIGSYSLGEELEKAMKDFVPKVAFLAHYFSHYQLEGYLNLTNPYIINAEGNNWNHIKKSSNKAFKDLIDSITYEEQEKLSKLQVQSKKEFDKYVGIDKENLVELNGMPVSRMSLHTILQRAADNNFTNEEQANMILMGNIESLDEETQAKLNRIKEIDLGTFDGVTRITMSAEEFVKEYSKAAEDSIERGERYSYFKNHIEEYFNPAKAESIMTSIGTSLFYDYVEGGFYERYLDSAIYNYVTTNDIVKDVIKKNKTRKNKYDGVIIKNVIDYGHANGLVSPADVYVSFNSNQFKAVTNQAPTADNDIRYEAKDKMRTTLDSENPSSVVRRRRREFIEKGDVHEVAVPTSQTTIEEIINEVFSIEHKNNQRNSYGFLKGKEERIWLAQWGHFEAGFHELGHAIYHDQKLRFNVASIKHIASLAEKNKTYDMKVEEDLYELFKDLQERTGGYGHVSFETQLNEGFAEATKLYFADRETLQKQYPYAFQAVDRAINADNRFKKMAKRIDEAMFNYYHQTVRQEEEGKLALGKKSLSTAVKDVIKNKNIIDKTGAIKSIIKDRATDFKNLTLKEKLTNGVKMMFDEDIKVKMASDKLAKQKGLKKNSYNNIGKLVELASGEPQRIQSIIQYGIVDENDKVIFHGLDQVGELLNVKNNLGVTDNALTKQNFDDLNMLLLYQGSQDYWNRGLLTQANEENLQKIVDDIKNNNPYWEQIEKAADFMRNFNRDILMYAVKENLISREDALKMITANQMYVPMFRDMSDQGSNNGKGSTAGDSTKSRKGSTRKIIPPLESVVMNAAGILSSIDHNNSLRAVAELITGEEGFNNKGLAQHVPTPMKFIAEEHLEDFKKKIVVGYLESLENSGIKELIRETEDGTVQVDVADMIIRILDPYTSTQERAEEMNWFIENFTPEINFEATQNLFAPARNVDRAERIVPYIDNAGNRKYLKFDDSEVMDSILNFNKQGTDLLLKYISAFSQGLRMGSTTLNAPFAVRNIIRDTTQAYLFTNSNFIPLYDSAVGVVKYLAVTNPAVRKIAEKINTGWVKKQETLLHRYYQTGAGGSTRTSLYTQKQIKEIENEIYNTTKEAIGNEKHFKALSKFIDILGYIGDVSEVGTRLRTFDKELQYHLKQGETMKQALQNAGWDAKTVTTDFSQGGKLTKSVNKLVMFSNAKTQGAYTAYLRTKEVGLPKVALRTAILMALAGMIKGITADDDEIDEINQTKKDDNFIFRVGDRIVSIPKVQGIPKVMMMIEEYVIDLANGKLEGKEADRAGHIMSSILDEVLPVGKSNAYVLPTVAIPIAENLANYDFYYEMPIESNTLKQLPEEQRYDQNSSAFAVWLGNVIKKSPKKIDNLISGWFGSLGTQLSKMPNNFAENQLPNYGLETNEFTKGFFPSYLSSSQSQTDFYKRIEDLTLKKNGGFATKAEEKELEELNNAKTQTQIFSKKIEAIKADSMLSGEEKGKRIKAIQEQRLDIIRNALGKDMLNKVNNSLPVEYEFYPSANKINFTTKNKIKKTIDMTDDMKEEYKRIAYEKYASYVKTGTYSDKKLEELKNKAKDYAREQMITKYKDKAYKRTDN